MISMIQKVVAYMTELATEAIVYWDENDPVGSSVKLCLANDDLLDGAMFFVKSVDDAVANEDRELIDVGIRTPCVEVYKDGDKTYVADIFGLDKVEMDSDSSMEELRAAATAAVRCLYDRTPDVLRGLTYEEAAKFIGWTVGEMPDDPGCVEERSYKFGVRDGVIVELVGCDDERVNDDESIYAVI